MFTQRDVRRGRGRWKLTLFFFAVGLIMSLGALGSWKQLRDEGAIAVPGGRGFGEGNSSITLHGSEARTQILVEGGVALLFLALGIRSLRRG